MHHIKTILTCLCLLSALVNVNAQQYDKTWALGLPVSTLTFEQDTVIPSNLQDTTTLSFNAIGSICDSSGNFLFYSNGINVYNRYGHIMPNGDSLSYPSEYYDQVVYDGMPNREDVLILPKPNDTNLYYIFHYSPVDTILTYGGYESLNLYYTIVDMRLDSGRGVITQKNVPILQNELLSASRLTACRHANGRDWWIVKNAWHENIYYKFLLTPDSIEGPFIQQIGPSYGSVPEDPAYSQFSPDGSKYASTTLQSYLVIMDFDRCTGLFSNPDSIYNFDSDGGLPSSGGAALCFSPNSRFLYVNSNLVHINQYDLWSVHRHDSILIANDTNDFYKTNIMQLAPNNKIYISTFNGGSYSLDVINNPDSLGLASNFQLFAQAVLQPNSWNLPYFPNFRLGPLPGACDTIRTAISATVSANSASASIAPNPATDKAILTYLNLPATGSTAALYDITGRLVWSEATPTRSGQLTISTATLPAGLYFIKLTTGKEIILSDKLVVARSK